MPTYPIPEYLTDSHDGDEWAIAAIMGGRVVALRYITDIAPQLTKYLDSAATPTLLIKQWMQTSPIELRELQMLGEISAGLITSEGFIDYWTPALNKDNVSQSYWDDDVMAN